MKECGVRSARSVLAGCLGGILLILFGQVVNLRAQGLDRGRVFGRALPRSAWVVPVMLVGGGWMLVEGVHLSGGNRAWTSRYGHRREAVPYVDDALQYGPAAMLLGMKLLGCPGATASHVDMVQVSAASALVLASLVNGIKAMRIEARPDGSSWSSFISGHTATAFWGAELLRREYGSEYPWVSAGAYGVAVATGFFRVYHRRHWIGDVIAGAGIGIASVWLGELLHPYVDDAMHWSVGGRRSVAQLLEISCLPTWSGRGVGLMLACRF